MQLASAVMKCNRQHGELLRQGDACELIGLGECVEEVFASLQLGWSVGRARQGAVIK